MDVLTFILFSIVLLTILYWRWERSSYVSTIDRIPGPPKVPIFGNIFSIPRDGLGFFRLFMIDWRRTYGDVYRFWRGMYAIINISSPFDAETMLSSQKHINKSITGEFLKPWLGDGLLLSAGNKWRKDRKLLTPAFHFQILDGFFDVFNRNANILAEQIQKKMFIQSEVDIYPLTSLCTLDIICEAAMGVQIDAQYNCDSEYIIATDKIEKMIQARITSILAWIPDWAYFRLTPHGRKLQSYLKIVHGFTRKVLRSRKEQLGGQNANHESENLLGTKKRRAFLDLLLEAVNNGADLNETDIITQVDTFMFAGHDTTSAAVTWFLYCMATHPHIQERVYEEIQDCFGDSNRPCTLEDLPQLKYLDCCVKESLRRHSPVPFIRRRVNEDTVFSGFKIPVGASVGIQIYAIHRNEEFFPDPESYKPERFEIDQTIGRFPYAFIPFSAGPRNCIGQKFAIYEAKVILTTLLRKFRFDIDLGRVPIKESLNMILKPVGGMPLLITPRL